MSEPDFWTDFGEPLAAVIAAGTYEGDTIDAQVMPKTGDVTPTCARVISPRVVCEGFGEGWRVAATEWPVLLYTAKSGEIDLTADMAFLTAVLEALDADPTLDGATSLAMPIDSDVLGPQPYTSKGKQRLMLMRALTVRIDH